MVYEHRAGFVQSELDALDKQDIIVIGRALDAIDRKLLAIEIAKVLR